MLATLGEAETSVAEGVRARRAVVEKLTKLLEEGRAAMKRDEEAVAGLKAKRGELERERGLAEDAIVRGLEAAPAGVDVEALRPDMEPLTPPPVESLTPVGSPKAMPAAAPEVPAAAPARGDVLLEIARDMDKRGAAGADGGASAGQPAAKRRRIDTHADEFDGLQGDVLGNIDPDVAAMLARD